MKLGYLPPANKVCGKVMFLHVSVILFTRGDVHGMYAPLPRAPLPHMHPVMHAPPAIHDPCYTCPPSPVTHAPCHTCPPPCTPPWQHGPPPNDMVNERAVRILLECILVLFGVNFTRSLVPSVQRSYNCSSFNIAFY